MSAVKIYSNRICPFAQRALITALEKAVKHEVVEVPLDNMPDWYAKVNPRMTVPALEVQPGVIVPESMIIAKYLDEAFGEPRQLQPGDAQTQYEINYFIDEFGNSVGAMYETLSAAEADVSTKAAQMVESLKRAEALAVKQSGGPFFLGTTFSLADIACVPFLERFRHTLRAYHGINVFAEVPRLQQLHAAAMLRPSVRQTTFHSGVEYVRAYKGYATVPARPEPLKLYTSNRCPFAHRARIAAALKEVNVEHVELDLNDMPSWYAKINHRMTVPTLEVGPGEYVQESMLIVEYLEQRYTGQGVRLAPATPLEAAQARFFIDDFSIWAGFRYGAAMLQGKGDKADEARKEFESDLTRLNTLVEKQSKGPFFFGEHISLPDVAVIPFLYNVDCATPLMGGFEPRKHAPRLFALLDAGVHLAPVAKTLKPRDEMVQQLKTYFQKWEI